MPRRAALEITRAIAIRSGLARRSWAASFDSGEKFADAASI